MYADALGYHAAAEASNGQRRDGFTAPAALYLYYFLKSKCAQHGLKLKKPLILLVIPAWFEHAT